MIFVFPQEVIFKQRKDADKVCAIFFGIGISDLVHQLLSIPSSVLGSSK